MKLQGSVHAGIPVVIFGAFSTSDGCRSGDLCILTFRIIVAHLRGLLGTLDFLRLRGRGLTIGLGCFGALIWLLLYPLFEILVLTFVAIDKESDQAPECFSLILPFTERILRAQRIRAQGRADIFLHIQDASLICNIFRSGSLRCSGSCSSTLSWLGFSFVCGWCWLLSGLCNCRLALACILGLRCLC